MMKKILLHTCCAPCSVFCVESLREESYEPVAFWYNPNIHPYQEYVARRNALMEYAPRIGMELVVKEEYGLRAFVQATVGDLRRRCNYCYAVRMEETARYAYEHGYDVFTTTLLVSPYQQHERIAETAERAAERYGVRFVYRDFRRGFWDGQAKAREEGLYMQKYCGCVFSEEERYKKQIARDLARNEKAGL